MKKNDLQLNLMSESSFIGQSNIDIEEIVLATFVNYPESYFKVADQLSVSEFSVTETKYIYMAIKELAEVSKIDIATVTDKLIQKKYTDIIYKQKKGFDLVVMLNGICERVDNDYHLLEHCKLLNGYAKRRKLTALADDIKKKCNDMVDPMEVISDVSTTVVEIQEMGDIEEFDLNAENKKVLKGLDSKKDGETDVRTHIDAMDKFLYCLEPSELIIIGAAPSMGKTSLALEIFKNQIVNEVPAAFFSLEMGVTQLLNRMYAVESEVPLSNMRTRNLSPLERKKINVTIGEFERKKKFFIDDRARKISHIANKIRKYVIRHKVKIAIIDYLQLMTCDMGRPSNREQEISIISRTLKELATELGIPIIALSQINRGIHSRAEKRPTLGDLRESGSIEQDADMVIFVHRPAYFELAQGIPYVEEAELIIAKGRSTGVGTVYVKFKSSMTKFISNEQELQTHSDSQGSFPENGNIAPSGEFDS
jgi:replicative DNA helicase